MGNGAEARVFQTAKHRIEPCAQLKHGTDFARDSGRSCGGLRGAAQDLQQGRFSGAVTSGNAHTIAALGVL